MMRCGTRGGGIAAAGLALLLLAGRATADQITAIEEKYRQPIDDAVDKALIFLAKSQAPDGSYPPKHTAVVSLCTMAFLAKGYTPKGSAYSEVITRGIDFVLASQSPSGELGGGMYNHNISTLMLSEISGMVDGERQKKTQVVLGKALQATLMAQAVVKAEANQGGWRYSINSTDSDISLSGWPMLALRSAYNNGAQVPKESIDKAIGFIMNCRNADGGFGYTPGGGSGLARTGIGLLCLELSGRHRDEKALSAAKFINARVKNGWGSELYYYAIYYTAQSMFQMGGAEWETFAPVLYDNLLKLQAADGSWPNTPDGHNAESGPEMRCYRTAMAVLALSVTYRQLPIYQRD